MILSRRSSRWRQSAKAHRVSAAGSVRGSSPRPGVEETEPFERSTHETRYSRPAVTARLPGSAAACRAMRAQAVGSAPAKPNSSLVKEPSRFWRLLIHWAEACRSTSSRAAAIRGPRLRRAATARTASTVPPHSEASPPPSDTGHTDRPSTRCRSIHSAAHSRPVLISDSVSRCLFGITHLHRRSRVRRGHMFRWAAHCA
jgi:hypothetical protein